MRAKDALSTGSEDEIKITNELLNRDLILNFNLFGYRLNPENSNPFDRDENAFLILSLSQDNLIQAKLLTKFNNFLFEDLYIDGVIQKDVNDSECYRYEVGDPLQRFFMEFNIYSTFTKINVAFDDFFYQYSYDGIFDSGFEEFSPFLINTMNQRFLKDTSISLIEESSSEFIQNSLKNKQLTSTHIFYRSNGQKSVKFLPLANGAYSITSVITTNYGVVHEGVDFNVDYPSDLPDNYWEPYTQIDQGIYRMEPSESQIKSDLQYYTTYIEQRYGDTYDRNLMVYTMGCHGGPEWEITSGNAIIYPSEISSLWYRQSGTFTVIVSYPYDTIIMVDVCWGYWKVSGQATMAHAFIDYYADAFVGPTLEVPGASDDYMYVFWDSLAVDHHSVYNSVDDLCTEYGSPWNVGDEWQIMGDSSVTIPH